MKQNDSCSEEEDDFMSDKFLIQAQELDSKFRKEKVD